MRAQTTISIAALFLLLLSGCGVSDTFRKTDFSDEDSMVNAMTFDSNLRSVLIVNKRSNRKICSEPAPDSDESKQSGISAKVAALKSTEGAGIENGMTSASLGGRNSTVLLAREILYRGCELGMNTELTFEQASTLFTRSLEAIEKISDTAQATATETKALTATPMWSRAPASGVGDSTTTTTTSTDDDSTDSDDSE